MALCRVRLRSLHLANSLLCALLAAVAFAEPGIDSAVGGPVSWPQFRGPERDATVPGDGLARAWPESGPVELWRRPVGTGFSTLVVDGGMGYTMEAVGEEEAVLGLDIATGETLWRTVLGVPMESEFGRGPRTTPTLSEGKLFTVTSQKRLAALDAETGQVLWAKDLTNYEPAPRFGYSMSPLVIGQRVLVDIGTKDLMDAARAEAEAKAKAEQGDTPEPAADGEPAPIQVPPQMGAIAAFDVATGDLAWRGGFPGSAGYSSPIVLTLGGVPQIVVVRRDSTVGMSFDGKELWTYSTPPTAAIAMPVQLSDDTIFISSSDDHFGGKALKVVHGDDGWTVEEAWAERLMRNHFNTSVARDGVLYGFDNTTFKALDAETGTRLWAHRGFGKGSLLSAGDLLYVLSDTGALALVQATPEEYRELGRVQAMTGKAWTSPSLAAGRVYLRDHDEMVAYDVREATLAAAREASVSTSAPASQGELSDDELAALRQAAAKADGELSADQIWTRYTEARGGAERWRQLKSLSMTGTYHAFSETSEFVLRKARGEGAAPDNFYLHYLVFDHPAIRAVDAEGPWLQHKFLSPVPFRVGSDPDMAAYIPQMLRESHFAPLLLDAKAEGLTIEKAGTSEINGRPTLDLKVIWPAPPPEESAETPAEPISEVWHLDPVSFLEVAVDSQVFDYTQGGAPFRQREYMSDFRQVEGVMIPYRVEAEFNARFEGMTVDQVEVNAQLSAADFALPPAPAAPETDADP